ncbi:two-component system regulatory protein YycI [Lapidilactobacillus bayanensis]|uniref:two-component system regulatory protein YycI n=1 Tax=Lapidilactobacillus bayanensis TaxID=2485998 RepID=UPI000F7A0B66|nr:two-component system regulatory protein YycI [Lapidilactobacillus bayanensis]
MDFRRIEWIFLIVFIGLDIFLGVSYMQNNNNIVFSDDQTASTSSTILRDMRDDNITVGSLSTKQSEGYYLSSQVTDPLRQYLSELSNQTYSYNRATHILRSEFGIPVLLSKKKAVAELKLYVKTGNNIIFGSHYEYSAGLSSNDNIVFIQKTKHGAIIDSQGELVFKISNNAVVSYTQTYVSDLTVLREKQTTISAYDAVQLLYISSEIPENSKIIWCKLGYSELINVRGSVIFVPVWNVMVQHKGTNNEALKKVNALNSTVIKNQSSSGSTTSSSSSSSTTETNSNTSTNDASTSVDASSILSSDTSSSTTTDSAAIPATN